VYEAEIGRQNIYTSFSTLRWVGTIFTTVQVAEIDRRNIHTGFSTLRQIVKITITSLVASGNIHK
jgi:hypothetical protein